MSDPKTGEPGVHLVLFGEAGNVLEEQSGVPASAVIGFDDDLPEWVFSATFSARLAG